MLSLPPAGALTQDYFPATQTQTTGTVTGTFPDAIEASEDTRLTLTEADTTPDTTHDPDGQVLTKGTNCGGTFPGDLTVSDNAYLCHQEANQAVDENLLAESESLNEGIACGGGLPDVNTDNAVVRCIREENLAGASTFLTPDSEVLTKAISVSGGLSDEYTDNGVSRVIREQDQASADVNDDPDTQTLTTGTNPTGTFPTCIATSDDSKCTYLEADVGGSGAEEVGAIGFRATEGTVCVSDQNCVKTLGWSGSAWNTPFTEYDTSNTVTGVRVRWDPASGSTIHYIGVQSVATLGVLRCTDLETCSIELAFFGIESSTSAFDMQIEQSSGDVLLVYDPTSDLGTCDYAYRVRTAGSWGGETCVDHPNQASAGALITWMVLVNNPGTNRIGLGYWDDTNLDAILGMWDGTAWLTGNHQAACATDEAETSVNHGITLLTEDSADEFVAYCASNADDVQECEWTSASGWEPDAAACTGFDPDTTGNNNALSFSWNAYLPSSNEGMVCHRDDLADIQCWEWDGVSGTGGSRAALQEFTANDGLASQTVYTYAIAYNPDQTGTTDVLFAFYSNTAGTVEWGTYNTATNAWSCTSAASCSNLSSAGVHPQLFATRTQQATNTVKAHLIVLDDTNSDLFGYRWTCSSPGAGCVVNTLGSVQTFTTEAAESAGINFHFAVQETPAAGANYNLDIRYEWTAVAAADTYTLSVEAVEFDAGDTEDMLIQVDDGTESNFVTRYTFTSDTDSTQATYALTAGEYDAGAPMLRFRGATESGDTTQGTTAADRVFLIRGFTDDFELEYRLAWTTETCVGTRILTVNAWRTGANMENVVVQVLDSTEVTYTTRLTVTATADGTTLTYTLTDDEWDAGDPNIRMLGTTEAGDTLQGDYTMDYVVIECAPAADYELEYRLDWTNDLCTGTLVLTINAWRANANMENVDVQVRDWDLGVWNTRLTVIQTTDTSTQTYTLTGPECEDVGGSIAVLYLGTTESGDTLQGDFHIDLSIVVRTPPPDFEMEYRVDWVEAPVPVCDTYRLRVEAFHTDTEDILLQVDDGSDTPTFVTRLTITAVADPNTYQTYDMTVAEFDLGLPLIRFLGSTETGDSTQTDLNIDDLEIFCITVTYELSILYDWAGIDVTGNSWTLIIECARGSNPENALLQVDDGSESNFVTRYTCDQDADTTYSSYALTAGELDAGAPSIRLFDSDQTDNSQSTWNLDLILIRRDYDAPAVTVVDEGPGGRGTDPTLFQLTCRTVGLAEVACHVTLNASRAPGVSIQQTDWYLDGEYRANGTSLSAYRHAATFGEFGILRMARISVDIHIDNGQSFHREASVWLDNGWLIGVAVLAIALCLLAGLGVHHRRKNARRT